MKYLSQYKNSLVLRLMLAFMLVAVPSVLLSSEIATRIATQTFNKAVENWLRETTDYVIASMKETQQELEGAFTLLQDRFSGQTFSFSDDEIAAMRKIGVESIIVRDAGGETLFSSGTIRSVDENPLYPGGKLRWVTVRDGERSLAFVVEKSVQTPDLETRSVSLAEEVSLDTYFSGKGAPSLALRIFIPRQGGFEQVFSSANGVFTIPGSVSEAILSGAPDHFVPDKDWTDNRHDAHLLFKAVRDNSGNIRALIVSSATMKGLDMFVVDSSLFFWTLFIGGVLISCSIGYVLAKRIVKPIKELDAGVQNIASGRLGYEVPVSGNDEVAGLAQGFNMMSRQLEAMQQEKMQFAKRERARMLGEIALGFAHEIRNPLLVIKTSAKVLHNRLPVNTRDVKLLGFVIEEVERINTLISEFLGFAKPSAPNMAAESLSELAGVAIALCQAKFSQHGIVCNMLNELEDDTVRCDARQMQQVFLNLILNAVDAMPNGGILTVRIHAENEGYVCLDISDTGQGISADLLSSIHLPFVSTKDKGLGLGLSKVYAIIEEHGGNISCLSSEGNGTTFTVYLKK